MHRIIYRHYWKINQFIGFCWSWFLIPFASQFLLPNNQIYSEHWRVMIANKYWNSHEVIHTYILHTQSHMHISLIGATVQWKYLTATKIFDIIQILATICAIKSSDIMSSLRTVWPSFLIKRLSNIFIITWSVLLRMVNRFAAMAFLNEM